MTHARTARIAIWLAGLALCAWQAANTRFIADLSSFLPGAPTPEQRLLVEQLREGALSRVMLLGIEGADASARAGLSRALAAALRASPEFVAVANGGTAGLERERELLFEHRYALSPAVSERRFTVEGLREAISESIALLASPAGLLVKQIVARDPTGEIGVLLERYRARGGPRVEDGVWVSPDTGRAILIARSRASGSDTDAQARAIAAARLAFAEAQSAIGGNATEARLLMTGTGVFSAEARAMIEGDVKRLALFATALIATILLAVFRSPLVLALCLLPVATGAVAGVAAVSLADGVVHGITLGFGLTLIGEAVDYSIYLFLQARTSEAAGNESWIAGFWPTIRLGVATSIAGFSALLLSGLPGLSQLGLYSIAGLVAAAAVTRHVLPALLPAGFRVRDVPAIESAIAGAIAFARRLRHAVPLLAIVAIAVLALHAKDLWNPDLASLNPIPERARILDAELRGSLGAPDARIMVAVTAPTQDAALAAAESVGRALDPLVAAGKLSGYESAARILPSVATQQARRESLPDGQTLRTRLELALADLPLRPGKLEPFIADVERARVRPPLTREAFAGTALDLALDGLLFARAEGSWTAIIGLRGAVRQGATAGIDATAVRAAVEGANAPGAIVLDLKAEADRLYAGYLDQAMALSAAGVAVIVLLLAGALRSVARAARVLAPLAAAVVVVAACHALLGTRLTIPHLIGLVLIVAIGSNYALFFDRVALRPGPGAARTLASLAVANATTVAGFGVLSISSIPVLNAIGSTVALGAFLSLAFAAALAPDARERAPGLAAA